MRIHMKYFVALLCLVSTLETMATENFYAGIAFSKRTSRVGEANDERSFEDMRDTALRDCGERDCVIMTWVRNGCVAYSTGRATEGPYQYWYGFAQGATPRIAEKYALSICEFNAKNYCTVVTSFCTSPTGEPVAVGDVEALVKYIGERTDDAWGIVDLVNRLTAKYLRKQSHISGRTEARIRQLAPFASLRDLVDRTRLPEQDLRKLWATARTMGFIKRWE